MAVMVMRMTLTIRAMTVTKDMIMIAEITTMEGVTIRRFHKEMLVVTASFQPIYCVRM